MKKLFLMAIILVSAFILAACSAKDTLGIYPEENTSATEAIRPFELASPSDTAGPTETWSPIPSGDPFLILVNFDHQIYEEPPVVLVCDYLTANNVYCDPRRHANETAVKALNEMLLAAEQECDFHFIIASAFRYIWEQQMMWEGKIKEDPTYGSDPYNNPVKLMPTNCSEHTTGLAFDILCESCPHSNPGYELTPEAQWLAQNAHRFGFILRYPNDKQHITGVQYEPWHFRYVGKNAAEYIYEHSLCLEEYLSITDEY
ncbi:MAG: M15 family metallopeptidase [Clostridia bacterium]|nr:M15 family metallopeptidase [Clostridia bacterium]